MSVQGTSFTGGHAGSCIDFGVGSAGLANLYAAGYTVAVLAKFSIANFGFLAGYSDTSFASPVKDFFVTNNTGAKLFTDNDFSSGFPASPGLDDSMWRWQAVSKPSGAAHNRFHYADLATLTWVHGESVGSANQADNATPCQRFSTFAIFPWGFNQGDVAAIVAWFGALSDASIEASCTRAAAALSSAAAPKAGWLFPAATAGNPVTDFTGGGADEIARTSITTSADPPGFSFALGGTPIASVRVGLRR